MARITFIEDDPALGSALSLTLSDAGHEVSFAEDGEAGLPLTRTAAPELIISDVNMPRLDGFSLCRRLREAGNHVPIILLTSRDSEIDEALGLELGADDYLTKPFSTRVLLARVQAILRRQQSRGENGEVARLVVGKLELCVERLEVRYARVLIPVTVTEFRLLEALTRKPGVVWSRDQLLTESRGDDSIVVDRIIDSYVRRLRRKLEAVDPTFDGIETVIGAGYRWRSER